MTGSVLMVLTSHQHLGNTGVLTGSWLEELAAPYYTFLDAGLAVELLSIAGGSAPIDPLSSKADWLLDAGIRFLADSHAQEKLRSTAAVSTMCADSCDAIFFVGGSGTAWDFPLNADIKRLVEAMNRRRALIAGVCHGVLGLIAAEAEDGLSLLKGRRVTGISNREDELAGVAQVVPLLPEEHLKKVGAIYLAAAPFEANVVTDGHIITGQNPASAQPLAQAIVRRLKLASAA